MEAFPLLAFPLRQGSYQLSCQHVRKRCGHILSVRRQLLREKVGIEMLTHMKKLVFIN